MDTLPNSIEARDGRYHMHSYSNARVLQEQGPLIMEKGEGIYVYDNNGKRYTEAMAGLWSVGLGFSEQRLVDAATEQMKKLPYYHTFSHRGHTPAAELAEKLVEIAPVPMSKAFFTNSGSEANDTAVKMLWYRANALGTPEKRKVISRLRGYHGITAVAASMTGLPMNHMSFGLPLPGFLHTGSPHYWKDCEPGETEEQFSARRAAELEALILEEAPNLLAQDPGGPAKVRHHADRRRGDLRVRPHRQDVRHRDLRAQARHHDPVQADFLLLSAHLGAAAQRKDVRAAGG